MKKLIPILTIFAIVSFTSCDKIEHPLQEGITPQTGDSTVVVRRILMEEFTGHFCTACPAAAVEMERLVSVYGDQIIPIALHAGNTTFNEPHTGAGSYETDFRTPAGNAYATQFQPFGLPSGMVSRITNGTAIPAAQWEAEIVSLKDLEPEAEIKIETTYDDANREVTIDVESEWLLEGDQGAIYRLQVYIIEDHIIDWQLNNGVDIPDYDHRHVLRGAVNPIWGDVITNTTQGTIDDKTFTYTLATNWDKDNCEIVAFIYKEGPDYEVMQANIEPVTTH
ncbi:MAG: Omp28 family outer membrane lipoprotein [Vicingaceae bacterium]